MRAGELRHRVEIDEPIEIQNATGEPIVDWQTRAKVFASVEPLSGREFLLPGEIYAQLDTRIRIRWSPTVDRMTPKWRIRHEATIYNIVSVAHLLLGRREMVITANTGKNDG